MISRNLSATASALLLAIGLFGHSETARAGDVSNAELTCFVDTYAYDYSTVGYCESAWTPSTATNPTTAVFEVTGLPSGNYSFAWKNLETGATGVCASSNSFCFQSIGLFNSPSVIEVTVRDTDTNATKTLNAYAYFWDGWN